MEARPTAPILNWEALTYFPYKELRLRQYVDQLTQMLSAPFLLLPIPHTDLFWIYITGSRSGNGK